MGILCTHESCLFCVTTDRDNILAIDHLMSRHGKFVLDFEYASGKENSENHAILHHPLIEI